MHKLVARVHGAFVKLGAVICTGPTEGRGDQVQIGAWPASRPSTGEGRCVMGDGPCKRDRGPGSASAIFATRRRVGGFQRPGSHRSRAAGAAEQTRRDRRQRSPHRRNARFWYGGALLETKTGKRGAPLGTKLFALQGSIRSSSRSQNTQRRLLPLRPCWPTREAANHFLRPRSASAIRS